MKPMPCVFSHWCRSSFRQSAMCRSVWPKRERLMNKASSPRAPPLKILASAKGSDMCTGELRSIHESPSQRKK